MSKRFELRGIGVVNASPLTDFGDLDEKEYRRHVKFLADSGISYIQPAAATGQSLETSDEEFVSLLEWSVDEVGDRLCVTAYTGRDSTAETIRMTKLAERAGASCAFIIQPFFSAPDAEGIFRHYAAVAEAVELPLVIYNNPSRAGVSISIDVMERLVAAYPNYVGLKQSDLSQFADSYSRLSDAIHVMPKSEREMLYGFVLGSEAVLTFAGNLVPAELVEIYNAFQVGDIEAARKTYFELLPIFNAIHMEPVPGVIKHVLNQSGWRFGEPRLPGHPLLPDTSIAVDRIVAAMKRISSAQMNT